MARATQWTADRVLDKGSQGGVLLVAVAGDEVRGFGYGVPGEVVGFYVDPRSWGSGLAAVLLTALVGALGEGPVLLWTLAGSTQARRFYEKNDWVLTGRRRDVELVAGCAREVLEYSLRP